MYLNSLTGSVRVRRKYINSDACWKQKDLAAYLLLGGHGLGTHSVFGLALIWATRSLNLFWSPDTVLTACQGKTWQWIKHFFCSPTHKWSKTYFPNMIQIVCFSSFLCLGWFHILAVNLTADSRTYIWNSPDEGSSTQDSIDDILPRSTRNWRHLPPLHNCKGNMSVSNFSRRFFMTIFCKIKVIFSKFRQNTKVFLFNGVKTKSHYSSQIWREICFLYACLLLRIFFHW